MFLGIDLGSSDLRAKPVTAPYDSIDLSATLLRNEPSARHEWFFYGPLRRDHLWAARVGQCKLVFESQESLG